jgi:hypothetical protein
MSKSRPQKTLYAAYRFPGFTAERWVKGRFGDRTALVIRLNRRSKKLRAGPAAPSAGAGTTAGLATSAICRAAIAAFTLSWISAASSAESAAA